MRQGTRLTVVASFVVGSFVLSACAPDIRKSGYYPLESEMEAVSVGQTTRAEVLGLVGSPSIGSPNSDGVIYYVGQRVRHFGPMKPEVVDRQVVVVSFDSRDRVSNVQVLGLEDGQVVVISQRVTETISGDFGFFQQLFGNIGNVSAAQIVDS